MPKMIKLKLKGDKKNLLTEAQKRECSKKAMINIKDIIDSKKPMPNEGAFEITIDDRVVKAYWSLEEDIKEIPEDMLKKADFIMEPGGKVLDVDDEYIKAEKKKNKILDFAESMPKGQAVGFFLLAAYISGRDMEHVEEIKKLKAGEAIDIPVFAYLLAKREELIKSVTTKEEREKINRLLAEMHLQYYNETGGVHKEDKNKLNIKDYSDGSIKEIHQAIDVTCVSCEMDSDEKRLEFSKHVQKECDKAILGGQTEGDLSYTFEDGVEVKAHWKINEDKDYIKNLKLLRNLANVQDEEKTISFLNEAFQGLDGTQKLGLCLLTGHRMGYDMPYLKEAKNMMLGINAPEKVQKGLVDCCLHIMARIGIDEKEEEAAKTIEAILQERNN